MAVMSGLRTDLHYLPLMGQKSGKLTSWYGKYPIICRVLYILGGWPDFFHEQYELTGMFTQGSKIYRKPMWTLLDVTPLGFKYMLLCHWATRLKDSHQLWKMVDVGPIQHTLPEIDIATENWPSQKESNLPTIHFQVQAVIYWNIMCLVESEVVNPMVGAC